MTNPIGVKMTHEELVEFSNKPEVHQALFDFAQDPCEEAAIILLRQVITCAPVPSPYVTCDREEALGDVLAMMAVRATPEELSDYVIGQYKICKNPLAAPLVIQHAEGNNYRYIGEAIGAGKSKGMTNVRVYSEMDGRGYYFRHDPNDFFTRFKAVK